MGIGAIIVFLVAAVAFGSWWVRRHFLAAQRATMRSIHTLSEDIIAAESPIEIAEKLADILPSISQATTVRLYLLNRSTKSLENIPIDDEPEPMAIAIDAPQEGLASGVVKCFATRALLNIPDVRRNPLVNAGWTAALPRSAMFVPIAAKNECMGVIEAGSLSRVGYFTPEEQAAIQHLANQVATAIRLQEQQAVREQLFRSEKLAATGQLISGVASELRAPLDGILQLSAALAEDSSCSGRQQELKQLETESRRASEIVSRLVSFARPEDLSARPVDVNALISGLVQFRAPQWKTRGLRIQNRLSPEPAFVAGAPGQLEQVFLNLLVHAEQCAASATGKALSLSSTRIAKRILIELQYSSDAPSASVLEASSPAMNHSGQATSSAVGLDVCRGIVQNHGGEIRVVTRNGAPGFEHGAVGFEIYLPLAGEVEGRPAPGNARKASRSMTLMVVDSDISSQRQLVGLLVARGHRCVPVAAEQAADLAQRLRFDGVVWAVRPGGAKWSDHQDRVRAAAGAFVLVTDAYDSQLAETLAESGGYLLSRPIREGDLDRTLEILEMRAVAKA